MGVKSKTISITYYRIKCDFCGRFVAIDNSCIDIYNGRQAVRLNGWSMGRGDIVKCNFCRSHKRS